MRINFNVIRLLLAIATIISAVPVFASDGQLEINQACAVNTGCFSGDTPGFPVTIDGSAGRSYRLTGDLVIPSVDSNGILVSTPDVSIDLGGFTIIGVACVGEVNNCTPSAGSGSGAAGPLTSRGISVKNGSIIGMGLHGVLLGDQAEVSSLRVRWNRLDGIVVSHGSTVSGNTAYQNGDDGIIASFGSTVSGNTAYENGGDGIVSLGSTISGNTAYSNGDDGIHASSGSSIQRNTVRGNSNFGLRLFSDTAYRENVITGNTMGTVSGGVNMLSNSCNGKTTCP